MLNSTICWFAFVGLATSQVAAQNPAPKTPLRFHCTCDDPLTEHLATSFSDRLMRDAKYTEAYSASAPAWKGSLDSTVPPETTSEPSAIAGSIAVTHDGKLLDHWAFYCTKDQVDKCSEKLLSGVEQTIGIAIKAGDGVEVAEKPLPPESPSRPHTGDDLTPPIGTTGRGILNLICSADLESYVKVIDGLTNNTVRHVYVRANETVTIKGLPPGTYWVKVAQGHFYNPHTKLFTIQAGYFMFPDPNRFTETDDGTKINYKEISLTLNAVQGGNVTPRTITQEEFLADGIPLHTTY